MTMLSKSLGKYGCLDEHVTIMEPNAGMVRSFDWKPHRKGPLSELVFFVSDEARCRAKIAAAREKGASRTLDLSKAELSPFLFLDKGW
jgi:hypothetical protein